MKYQVDIERFHWLNEKFDLQTLSEKSQVKQIHYDLSSGQPWRPAANFTVIHQTVAEIFSVLCTKRPSLPSSVPSCLHNERSVAHTIRAKIENKSSVLKVPRSLYCHFCSSYGKIHWKCSCVYPSCPPDVKQSCFYLRNLTSTTILGHCGPLQRCKTLSLLFLFLHNKPNAILSVALALTLATFIWLCPISLKDPAHRPLTNCFCIQMRV